MHFPCTPHPTAPHLLWCPITIPPIVPAGPGLLFPTASSCILCWMEFASTSKSSGLCPAAPEAPLCKPARSVNPALAKGLPCRSRPVPPYAAKTAQTQTTCQEKKEKVQERSPPTFQSSIPDSGRDTTEASKLVRHQAGQGLLSQQRTCHCLDGLYLSQS